MTKQEALDRADACERATAAATGRVTNLIVERNALRLEVQTLEKRMGQAAGLLNRSPRDARDIDEAIAMLEGREEP